MVITFLIIDDIFPKDTLQDVKDEYKRLEVTFEKSWSNFSFRYNLDLFSVFKHNLNLSPTLMAIQHVLATKKIKDSDVNDFAYASFDDIDHYTLGFTTLTPGRPYESHTDMIKSNGRLCSLSFIVYLEINNKITGGELVIGEEVIDFKDNRMVILPSYLDHKTNDFTIKGEYKTPCDGRCTIVGSLFI